MKLSPYERRFIRNVVSLEIEHGLSSHRQKPRPTTTLYYTLDCGHTVMRTMNNVGGSNYRNKKSMYCGYCEGGE